jgi:hypothetical protein
MAPARAVAMARWPASESKYGPFFGVVEEADFDQHGGHVQSLQHIERGVCLLDTAVAIAPQGIGEGAIRCGGRRPDSARPRP